VTDRKWGTWPVNPDVFEGPNPHLFVLLIHTPDVGPVIAGIYSSHERATEAMHRRLAEGPAGLMQILPSVQIDFDLWQRW
jgi:hypothetical protein